MSGRHRLIGGAAIVVVVGLAVVGLLLILNDQDSAEDDSGDDIATAPAEESSTTEAGGDSDAGDARDNGESDSSDGELDEAPAEPSEPPGVQPVVARVVPGPGWGEDPSSEIGQRWLVPWDGGFLAIATRSLPVPFPELTEEQQALFPQEILDLFEDDPAESVQDASDRILEAGLDDAALEVLQSHPELDELIMGTPPEIVLEVWVSADGVDWEPLSEELLPPLFDPPTTGYLSFVASTGDRLALVSEEYDAATGQTRTITLATTTDLEEWHVETLEPDDPDAPEWGYTDTYISGFALGESGWVVAIGSYTYLDPIRLLPPADRTQLELGGPWTVRQTAEGIAVDTFNGDSASYTWDQLGIDKETYESYKHGQTETTVLTLAENGSVASQSLGGEAVELIAVTDHGVFATIVSPGGGKSELMVSTDGTSWDAVPTPPLDRNYFAAIWAFGDSLLLVSDKIYLGSPYGSAWTEVDISEAIDPQQLNLMTMPSTSPHGLAMVLDVTDYSRQVESEFSEQPPDTPWGDVEPEFAVLATVDGSSWLVEPLDVDPATEEIWAATTAISGDLLLVSYGDTTLLYDLSDL